LEEEAAAADKTRVDFVDDYTKKRSGGSGPPGKKPGYPSGSSHHSKNGSMHKRGRDDRDSHRDKHSKKARR